LAFAQYLKMDSFTYLLILLVYLPFITCYDSRCCSEGEGCFTTQKPFHKFPLPDCAEKLGVILKVSTREHPVGSMITRTLIPNVWSPTRQTVFIIHGYLEHGEKEWMINMKDALLQKDDLNVIIVGWQDGSNKIYYPQAASNVRSLGAEIAALVNLMERFEPTVRPYCIGFSLGSHVCAHIGMRSRLARITGIDPAGPFFELEDKGVGLDTDCADFVDVIHTHGLGKLSLIGNLGTLKQMGHVDFYPNGGAWQPGCKIDLLYKRGIIGDITDIIDNWVPENISPICSHMRAPKYFTDTIMSENICSYHTTTRCSDSYKIPSSCFDDAANYQEMGYNSNLFQGRGIFYLKTAKKSPYCILWD